MIFRTNKYYPLILLAAFIVGGCGNFSGNYDEIESSISSSGFMAVGDDGTILTSLDGTTWTAQTSGTSNDLYGATYKE